MYLDAWSAIYMNIGQKRVCLPRLGGRTACLTVVLVCMLYCMLGGDAASLTMKCTAPSVDSGLAAIQSSESPREANPSTSQCKKTNRSKQGRQLSAILT
jgi:hypothetical protein